MLDSKDYREASGHARALTGKGISQQAFNIFRTVAAVDTWRRSDSSLAGRLFEVHPEVSFREIAGSGLESKHTASGVIQRVRLIESAFPGQLDSVASQLRGEAVKADDVLDAFAALWTARRISAGQAVSLPADPPVDAFGIPMAIWF
jgi:predicted RNase H-like nuclease